MRGSAISALMHATGWVDHNVGREPLCEKDGIVWACGIEAMQKWWVLLVDPGAVEPSVEELSLNVTCAQKSWSFLWQLNISSLVHSCLCLTNLPKQAENQALYFYALRTPAYVGDSCVPVLFTVQTAEDGADSYLSTFVCKQFGKHLIQSRPVWCWPK